MKLSINILTWNTLPMLQETMEMLPAELEGIESEIIIVDNGSIDGCEKIATIKNPVNLGISKGKNQGIDASHGEFILLLDGDVVPVPNSIRCLLKYMEDNPGCEALGFHPNKWCNQKNKNGQIHHEVYCNELFDVKEHPAHCCYYGMYRRGVFEKGVRFDENYGPGYGWEDLDMYQQMKALGIKQWSAHINKAAGKYYHAVNSSINNRNCLGYEKYMETSRKRSIYFKQKWEGVKAVVG